MKRKVFLIVIVIAVTMFSSIVPAYCNDDSMIVEHFDDGSYAVIETTYYPIQDSIALFSQNTKRASRTYTYYNSSNVKSWDFTVKGTFSYNGSTSSAETVSTSYNIFSSGWILSSRKSSKSGSSVSATGIFAKNLTSKTVTIGLKCSPKGVISNL